MSFHFRFSALSTLAAILSASAVGAATLAPGDSILVTGTTAAANPELAGVVIQDTIVSTPNVGVPDLPFLFARFEVQNRVVRSAVDGTMVFMPRILFGANVTAGNLLVDRVEMFGLGNFAIDANYLTDAPGDRGPTTASRSADGETLDFGFGFPLVINNLFSGVREESYPIALKTDATAFENSGQISIFARAQGDDFNTYRFDVSGIAVPVVPLPSPLLMLLSGLGLMVGLRLKRG
ncbi:hypothetical protein [uncultured Marivita sp.]|uniref:hypothetical protein n=1 Tax=uncultured Marivita sp. TaxID=888080 RepID=UPI0026144364|nr:hypothetical protein [uncultured Marivita sp.]